MSIQSIFCFVLSSRKLRLRLLHKVAVPGRGGREVYEFGFVDGDSQMHAVSFQLSGKHLYEALEVNMH